MKKKKAMVIARPREIMIFKFINTIFEEINYFEEIIYLFFFFKKLWRKTTTCSCKV